MNFCFNSNYPSLNQGNQPPMVLQPQQQIQQPNNQYQQPVQHHQPTITINLPSSHTLQHTQIHQQQQQHQYVSIVNQPQQQQQQQQQQVPSNVINPHFNQQQVQYSQVQQSNQAQPHQLHQQQQQQHIQSAGHSTTLNNPINNSPQHGNYQSSSYSAGTSLNLNHMTPQSPGQMNSGIQQTQMMNSPGEMHLIVVYLRASLV